MTIRKPTAFRLEPDEEPSGPRVARKPRAVPAGKIVFEAEPEDNLPAVIPPAPLPPLRSHRWISLFFSALLGLVLLWMGLSVSELIEQLFVRSPALGYLGLGLAGLAALAALSIIFREIWGLMRLNRIEHIQSDAARAINHDDAEAAKRAFAGLRSLYAGRHDAALGLRLMAEHATDIMDPADRIRLADRDLVSRFDEDAHRIIARAARRVTMLTTITPAAALDILFVAAQNVRMLREIATLYGGRPSLLATMRLARMVIAHLALTGGLALSDNLVQHVLGKGLVGRLSARFGEGAVNGILTSRIGLAARDVCRPIPQASEAKETLSSLLRELVTFDRPKRDEPPPG